MTKHQKQRAIEETTIRTDYVIRALDWSHDNHCDWETVDLKAIKDRISGQKATVVDHSEEVDSLDSNVETEEAFSCFYPDEASAPEKGGFDDSMAFKTSFEKMAKQGFQVEFQIDHHKKYFDGNDSDLLVNSSLLQFAYGMGGMNKARVNTDGSAANTKDVGNYLAHLTWLSQPVFHAAMFQLILYSIFSKTCCLSHQGSN